MKKGIKWNDIYSKCQHNKYSQITNILKTATLKSNFLSFLKEYKISISIWIIAILAILFYTFRSNLMLVLYSSLLLIILFILALYNSTYDLHLKKEKLELSINFQKYTINYKDLVNIYLSKSKSNFLFIPFYIYSLNIIYNTEESPMLLSLPVVMLNKESVINFFESFETQMLENEEEELKQKEKDTKNTVKAFIIALLIILALTFIIGFIIYSIRFK